MADIRKPTNTTIQMFQKFFKTFDQEQIFNIITNGYASGKPLSKIRQDLEVYVGQNIKPIYFRTLVEMWYPDTFQLGLRERRNWFLKNYPIFKLEEKQWYALYDPAHPVYKHFTQMNIRNFNAQRAQARKREIPFEFDFMSWVVWWVGTGHFHERGVLNTNYQMCRKGDQGTYSWDNVYCATGEQNKADYHQINKKA
jgi:hypothetical protein